MSGTIDALFEQHEKNDKKKRDRLKTPEGATVTSPVAQPAAKATKPAEGDGKAEKKKGAAAKALSLSDYRIKKTAAAADAAGALVVHQQPADDARSNRNHKNMWRCLTGNRSLESA